MTTPKEVIAYKAFDADMKCRGFQYAVGQTYEHKGKVSLCNEGFHACVLPFDCFNYYRDSKTWARVRVVELSETRKGEDTKIVSAKITIEAVLTVPEWVRAQVAALVALVKGSTTAKATTGDYAHSATTGYSAHSATTGNYAHSATTGDYAHSATTGDYAHSATTGYYAHSATTGNSAHSATTGDYAHSAVEGSNAIAAALGNSGTAQGKKGSWLVLSHFNSSGELVCVKTAKVGTAGIKPDVKYRLTAKGKFVKAN